MLLELGPVAAVDALSWTRFARRLIAEMRMDPDEIEGVVCEDSLRQWSTLIDQWAATIGGDDTFRLTQTLDDEVAEYLLYSLTRAMTSPWLLARVTDAEHDDHDRFTGHVVKAFITGLSFEGRPCDHYQAHLRSLRA